MSHFILRIVYTMVYVRDRVTGHVCSLLSDCAFTILLFYSVSKLRLDSHFTETVQTNLNTFYLVCV